MWISDVALSGEWAYTKRVEKVATNYIPMKNIDDYFAAKELARRHKAVFWAFVIWIVLIAVIAK